jgi:hypothetical protein
MSRTSTNHAPARPRPTRSQGRSDYRGPVDREWITLSDHRKRNTAILVVVAIILTIFIGRLVELQALRGSALASEATSQRLKEISLPAERGAITDAAGKPLAVTVQAYNVTADQTLIADPVATANAMAPILSVDPAALAARLTGDRRFVYVAKDITPESWQRIADLGLPGILKEAPLSGSIPRAIWPRMSSASSAPTARALADSSSACRRPCPAPTAPRPMSEARAAGPFRQPRIPRSRP